MAAAPRELLALLQQFTVETDRYVDTVSVRDDLHRTDLNALGIMMGAARAGVTVTPAAISVLPKGRCGVAASLSTGITQMPAKAMTAHMFW